MRFDVFRRTLVKIQSSGLWLCIVWRVAPDVCTCLDCCTIKKNYSPPRKRHIPEDLSLPVYGSSNHQEFHPFCGVQKFRNLVHISPKREVIQFKFNITNHCFHRPSERVTSLQGVPLKICIYSELHHAYCMLRSLCISWLHEANSI